MKMINSKGEAIISPVLYFVLAILIVLAFMPIINSGTLSSNLQAASNYLTGQGYIVLAAGEYNLIAKEATAQAAVTAAQNTATTILANLHSKQYVYPEKAVSVTLPADGANPWTYGALTTVVPINTITSNFNIHGISISNMSATSSYVVRITYGAGDTEWGFFRISRGGLHLTRLSLQFKAQSSQLIQ
jgi:hypothetical protein